MTAPDMESIIAAVLLAHAPRIVYYSAEEGHVSCHGCDGNWASFDGFYTHQARAVLDALTEAGGVEWGVFRITDAPVMRPFDEAKFATKTAAEVFIKLGFLERVAKTLEPRSRITGPWERAE